MCTYNVGGHAGCVFTSAPPALVSILHFLASGARCHAVPVGCEWRVSVRLHLVRVGLACNGRGRSAKHVGREGSCWRAAAVKLALVVGIGRISADRAQCARARVVRDRHRAD